MAVHLNVSARDLRRLLDFGDAARLQDDDGPFPMSVLTDLAELVDCEDLCFEAHDAGRKMHLAFVSPIPGDESGSAADAEAGNRFYWRHFWQLPMCSYPDRTGDCISVTRYSDFRSAPGSD